MTEQGARRADAESYTNKNNFQHIHAQAVLVGAREELASPGRLRHEACCSSIYEERVTYEVKLLDYEAGKEKSSTDKSTDKNKSRTKRAATRADAPATPPPQPGHADMAFFDFAVAGGFGHVPNTFENEVEAFFQSCPSSMLAIHVWPHDEGACIAKLLKDCKLNYGGAYRIGATLGSLTLANTDGGYACASPTDLWQGHHTAKSCTHSLVLTFFLNDGHRDEYESRWMEYFRGIGGKAFHDEVSMHMGAGEEYYTQLTGNAPLRGWKFAQLEPDSCLLNLSGSGLQDFPLSYALTQFLWTKSRGFSCAQTDETRPVVWSTYSSLTMLHPCSQLGAVLKVHSVKLWPDQDSNFDPHCSSSVERWLLTSELFHTAHMQSELCAGMSKMERFCLLELLTEAVARYDHLPEKLIAAHEPEEKLRRHGRFGRQASLYDYDSFMKGDGAFATEHRQLREEGRATGLIVLPVKNLSVKDGKAERALFYCPSAQYNAEDTAESIEVKIFFLLS